MPVRDDVVVCTRCRVEGRSLGMEAWRAETPPLRLLAARRAGRRGAGGWGC